MPLTRLLPLTGVLLLSGCLYGVRERTDQIQCDLSMRPYDLAPPGQAEPPKPADTPEKGPPLVPVPPGKGRGEAPTGPTDVRTAALLQAEPEKPLTPAELAAQRLQVPRVIPGSETQPIDFTKPKPGGKPGERVPLTREEREAVLKKLYPDMPPLEPEPAAQPGPGGKPYTLADLQQLATRFSPTVKEAAAAVETARGNMLQARAYPNPTVSYTQSPSSSGLSPTIAGVAVSQTIRPGGKLKEQEAAARMALENAELALKRARTDLATQVRNAYFGVLVAWETVRVNRGVARLTDQVFLIQRDLSGEGFSAEYETATLRAQADLARLAYRQSLFVYQAAWRTLVAAVGLRERDLPLSQVAGRVDAFVPIYDYDKVLARVLTNHTDILSARNSIEQARYNLKLQQITPWYQDLSVSVGVARDFAIPPGTFTPTVTVGMPLSVWDQNKGNIIAAEGTLAGALEGPHAAELTWTTNVATAFSSYRQNLKALEDYRQTILPNQVRAYRGVFQRRAEVGGLIAPVRTPIAFADVVTAQQALTSSVTSYLGILGSLWTSVVSVADPLQTDDLFQLAEPMALPPIPDLDHLLPLPCEHDCPAHGGATGAACGPCAAQLPAPAVESSPRPAEATPARLPGNGGDGPFLPAQPAATPGFGFGPNTSFEPRLGGTGR